MQAVPQPKISIIMPVLNREETIEKAICSVLAQNYANTELIIIDGGSHDHTVGIIKRYDKHITYWHSKPDGSPTVAVNFGIQKATGDLIAILMADDWYELETFAKISYAFHAHPHADMFTCGGRIVYYDEKKQQLKPHWTFDNARALKLSFYNVCFAASAICCRFIKKSCYQRVGLMTVSDEKGRHMFSNDKEFLLRVILHHCKDVFVPHLGHSYFASKQSATFGRHRANVIRMCEEHMNTAEIFLKKYTLSFSQRFLLRYWYIDQSARILLFKILEGDFFAALTTAKQGIQKYPIVWPAAFVYTTGKILVKRTLRILQLTAK